MLLDTIDVDTPENMVSPDVHRFLRQNELVNIVQSNIEEQYQKFENLGQNYLQMFTKELEEVDKLNILTDLVHYVNKSLIPIVNIDDMDSDHMILMKSGEYIYEFICIDCYSSLIPALMETLNITSIEEFDNLINVKYLGTPGKFKEDFLNVVQLTIEQLMKLQNITPNIKQDAQYQRLLGKYVYYQEIVEFGDAEMFLHNYLRPVLSKYATDFIWKLL